jgi:hypothetical protein
MLDFSVGNAELQDKLEWVAQPPPAPPAQARDTDALWFNLRRGDRGDAYRGLMFFRAQGTHGRPVAGTAGSDGIGHVAVNGTSCTKLLGIGQDAQVVPSFVKVFIGFRRRASPPAHVFATLRFLHEPIPPEGGQIEEFSQVNVSEGGAIHMDMPQGWELGLTKTTVLNSSP